MYVGFILSLAELRRPYNGIPIYYAFFWMDDVLLALEFGLSFFLALATTLL